MKLSEMKPEIQALVARGKITWEEMSELRCNSWEWEAVLRALDDDALTRKALIAQANSQRPHDPTVCTTYDEACVHLYLPELCKRLKAAGQARDAFTSELGQKVADGQHAAARFLAETRAPEPNADARFTKTGLAR